MKYRSRTKWGFTSGLFSLSLLAALGGCSTAKGDGGSHASDGSTGTPATDGGNGVPSALKTDLQGILDDAVAQGATPGVAIRVSAGDKSWSAAAGVDDVDGKTAIAPDERFRAGSIIKTFVATAVLQAVEAGSLGLDDLLTDRLPSSITARIQNASSIQLGMLLDHRSGIPDWVTAAVYQRAVTDPAHVWTLDEILVQVEMQPAPFQPGEQYSYSNTNYILLGEILAAVSGRSWRQIVRDDVIARAGLEHTTLPDPGDPACDACAHGYQPMNDTMLDVTRVDPSMAGSSGGHALITTPGDLMRFFQQVRAGALFDDPATLKAMFAFQPAVEAETRQVGYGFGVMQMTSDGDDAVGHLGGTAGYQSFMLYVPATDRYLSGFINEMGGLAPVLGPVLARVAKP